MLMTPIPEPTDQIRLAFRNQALESAADLIEQDGWCRFRSRTADGRHCASGALGENSLSAYSDAYHALQRETGWDNIPRWNDWQPPFLGKRRVIRALRNATQQPLNA